MGIVAQHLERPEKLKEACVREALSIIESDGVEALSLREVARRLKVSHQAPYKHFQSRDHILAEAVRCAFASFSEHLLSRQRGIDPFEDLGNLGSAYIDYARKHPAQYRLMFGSPLPDPGSHREMMQQAEVGFQILRAIIARIKPDALAPEIEQDTLFAWSVVHGLASILETRAGEQLGLHSHDQTAVTGQMLSRICTAITAKSVDPQRFPSAGSRPSHAATAGPADS